MTEIAERPASATAPGSAGEDGGPDAAADFDLSTRYLGLPLRTPLVASSGPLTGRIETLQQLEEAGASAVVLPSLFEEQVEHDAMQSVEVFELGAFSSPEATSYFPDLADYETVGDRYLQHVRDAKSKLSIPVIGSLNGVTAGGWTRYATLIEEAGADALELNLYEVAADVERSAADIEAAQLQLVEQVRLAVGIPVAVKVGPFYTAFAHMARSLSDAGADGLVLFNRFYQPDIDVETLDVNPALVLSRSEELRLPLRWIAILAGRIDASLAATSGVHSGADVAKCLLAGADVAMMTSALLEAGPGHVATVERELTAWARAGEYDSVAQLKGSVSQRHVDDAEAYERANYIGALVDYANTFHSAQGRGPW